MQLSMYGLASAAVALDAAGAIKRQRPCAIGPHRSSGASRQTALWLLAVLVVPLVTATPIAPRRGHSPEGLAASARQTRGLVGAHPELLQIHESSSPSPQQHRTIVVFAGMRIRSFGKICDEPDAVLVEEDAGDANTEDPAGPNGMRRRRAPLPVGLLQIDSIQGPEFEGVGDSSQPPLTPTAAPSVQEGAQGSAVPHAQASPQGKPDTLVNMEDALRNDTLKRLEAANDRLIQANSSAAGAAKTRADHAARHKDHVIPLAVPRGNASATEINASATFWEALQTEALLMAARGNASAAAVIWEAARASAAEVEQLRRDLAEKEHRLEAMATAQTPPPDRSAVASSPEGATEQQRGTALGAVNADAASATSDGLATSAAAPLGGGAEFPAASTGPKDRPAASFLASAWHVFVAGPRSGPGGFLEATLDSESFWTYGPPPVIWIAGLVAALVGGGCVAAGIAMASAPHRSEDCGDSKERKAGNGERGMGMREHALALQVSGAADVQRILPTEGGYDCHFTKPKSSKSPLRLEVKIQSEGEFRTPLTGQDCVIFSATVSRPGHDGGQPVPVAFSSMCADFVVSLVDNPEVKITVRGEDIWLFDVCGGRHLAETPLASAPDHWQDFVTAHRAVVPSLGFGSPTGGRPRVDDAGGGPFQFQECALLAGAVVTLVGELHRAADGSLSMRPWQHGRAATSCPQQPSDERWRTSWERSPPAASGQIENVEKVLVSDDPSLMAPAAEPQAPAAEPQEDRWGWSSLRGLRTEEDRWGWSSLRGLGAARV